MSKLKLLIIVVVILGVIYGGSKLIEQSLSKSSVDTVLTSDNCQEVKSITYCEDAGKTLQLAIFTKGLVVDFRDSEAGSIKDQSLLEHLNLVVNGSYFRGSYVDAQHAGLLQIKGEPLYQIATNDDQVTHIVVFDEKDNTLKFEEAKDFPIDSYKKDYYTLFQTGPLLIKNSQVQTDLITASNNGGGKYLRTVLGYTSTGEKFFLITKVNYDLTKLSEKILGLPMFANKIINVVNLDGGTSTAMYSADFPNFNFGESKRLPSILGVKVEE